MGYPKSTIFDFSVNHRIRFKVGKHKGDYLDTVVKYDTQYLVWFMHQDITSYEEVIFYLAAVRDFSEKTIKETLTAKRAYPEDKLTYEWKQRVERED